MHSVNKFGTNETIVTIATRFSKILKLSKIQKQNPYFSHLDYSSLKTDFFFVFYLCCQKKCNSNVQQTSIKYWKKLTFSHVTFSNRHMNWVTYLELQNSAKEDATIPEALLITDH